MRFITRSFLIGSLMALCATLIAAQHFGRARSQPFQLVGHIFRRFPLSEFGLPFGRPAFLQSEHAFWKFRLRQLPIQLASAPRKRDQPCRMVTDPAR